MLTITEQAQTKFLEVIEAQGRNDLAVYLRILGRGVDDFAYDMKLIVNSANEDGDLIMNEGGLVVRVDAESAPELDGAVVDFDGERGGFKIDNPNPVWQDEVGLKVARIIMEQINPGIAGHGGAIMPVGVRDGVVYVRMLGGCQGCGMASTTLSDGVEKAIKAAVPEISEIVDITHHAAGENPYYPR